MNTRHREGLPWRLWRTPRRPQPLNISNNPDGTFDFDGEKLSEEEVYTRLRVIGAAANRSGLDQRLFGGTADVGAA